MKVRKWEDFSERDKELISEVARIFVEISPHARLVVSVSLLIMVLESVRVRSRVKFMMDVCQMVLEAVGKGSKAEPTLR